MDSQGKDGRTARRQKREKVLRITLLLAVIEALLLIILLGTVIAARSGGDEDESKGKHDESGGETESGEINQYAGYTVTAVPSSKKASGILMLVNSSYVYDFSENNPELVEFGSVRKSVNGTTPYQLSLSNIKMEKTAIAAMDTMLCDFYRTTGNKYVLVSSAYRTKAEQDATGSSIKGGYSDSHTGYSAALKVYQDGKTLDLRGGDYEWIYENAWKYGFVVRYPAEKVTQTGVSDYTYYFRYVGVAAAYYMDQNGLCLEEFLDLVHRYTFQGEHLIFTAKDRDGNDVTHEFYYVPAGNGTTTEVPVPSDRAYEISGDNAGGFIVMTTK